MASIILGQIAGNIGGAAYGEIGANLGQAIGGMLGKQIDCSHNNKTIKIQGRRLNDLNIQTSTYGKMIPIIYGTFKVAGNIIWGRPIKENIADEEIDTNKFESYISRKYDYSVTLAIAICEGEVDSLERIWANDKLIDVAGYQYFRFYNGSESQMPDSLIESFMGIGEVPTYRGIAYIVFENFNLESFGGRIPNFTFEIKRALKNIDADAEVLENMIESMVAIPGSGEFVYDTVIQSKISGIEIDGKFIQQGSARYINKHTYHNKANSIVSLDQLQSTCKNLKWIAPVVTWFTDSINLDNCRISPAVEYKDDSRTFPDEWQIGNFNRDNAYLISRDENNNPNYGGSVNDKSIIRFLEELRSRSLKIMFYPMFFVDLPGKPWRGRLTGEASQVEGFFRGEEGYNNFILHYANLVKDKVDAFIIGSELIGLTKIKDKNNNFPAVQELILLAKQVREILGKHVLISYAADWSEYHHAEGGWYNLDDLWGCSDIDFIGIDAYFPLTDRSTKRYDIDRIKSGWVSGEGYDYYLDHNKEKQELSPEYAWKNIRWWWENYHINPDGRYTNWKPKSKKIWFTEYGYPSVDAAPNQPNVFYDPKSIEGNIPAGSNGKIDFNIQRKSLQATEEFWKNSEFIENKFIWTWDMRPYPNWPDLKNVWRDHGLWSRGHWVSGKLGLTNLSSIIADLCRKADLHDFDVSNLEQTVDGYAITHQQTIKDSIEILQSAYFFDATYSCDKLKFVNFSNEVFNIDKDEISFNQKSSFDTEIIAEIDLPARIEVSFVNKYFNYEEGLESAQRYITTSNQIYNISLPLVLSDKQAKEIAELKLYDYWINRSYVNFILPFKYIFLEVGDLINFTHQRKIYKIIQLDIIESRQMKITAKHVNSINSDFQSDIEIEYDLKEKIIEEGKIIYHILNLPQMEWELDSSNRFFIAACSNTKDWLGGRIFLSKNQGINFDKAIDIDKQSIIGHACSDFKAIKIENEEKILDEINEIEILLFHGKLESISEAELLAGKNLAIIDDEIIQFKKAHFIEPYKYIISGLIRGKYNTTQYINRHNRGERFVLLNNRLTRIAIPKQNEKTEITCKILAPNQYLSDTESVKFII